MEQELKKKLKEEFNVDEHFQKIVLEFYSNLCNNTEVENELIRLDRKEVGKMLVVSLLKTFLVTVKPPSEYQIQWKILMKASKNFLVTFIDSEVCKEWAFPWEDNNYSVWTDKSTQPLVVKTLRAYNSNQVLKAIDIMNEIELDQNLIVLGSLDTRKIRKEVSLFTNLSQLDKNILEEVLTEFHLPFETVLKLLEKEKEAVLNEVTPSLLFDIITNKDKKVKEKLPKCYISRTLEASIIYDISIISDIIENGFIFLVSNNSRTDIEEMAANFLKKIPVINMENISTYDIHSIVLINEEINCYVALSEFQKSHPKKNVYFFKICKKCAKLESILLDGPNICVFENPKKKEINEITFPTDFCHKINILCAGPGTGKSTTFKVLHNQLLSQNYYPKFISFKDNVEFFKKFNSNDNPELILKHFLNIENEVTSSSCVELLKKFYVSKGRICLLFDALDELDSKYLDNAIETVMKLAMCTEYNLKIWISSRKYLKEQLENVFKVQVYDFSFITEDKQRKYIEERLDSIYEEKAIQNIIRNIYENFTLFERNSDVLGIPMQLYIITKVLIDNVDEDTDCKNLLVLSKLCDRFFKGNNETKYGIVALKMCLNESDFNSLQIQSYDECVQDIKNSSSVGIITNFTNDYSVFEHRIFAEYFCASYLANNQTGVNLKNFIFQPKYKTIRMLLNVKLSEDSPLHLAVIYRDFDRIRNADENEIKFCKDKGRRNLVQVAVSCGVNYPVWKLMDYNNYKDYFLDDLIYDEPTEISIIDAELEKIVKYLCSFCDLEEIDDLLKWSSYEYATNMNDLSIINIMLNFKPHNLLQEHCLIEKESVLGYSAKYGFINLVKCLCFKLSINFVNQVKFTNNELFNIGGCKAVDFAIKNDRADYLKFLIANNVDVNSNNNLKKWTPLHFAARAGHLQCLQEVIAKSEVNSKDSYGWTPLHFAAKKGHLKCLQKLIAGNGEVNSKNIYGWTPLYYAAKKGHFECLQELISKNGQVNSKDPYDWTPLHVAAQNGHLECVQELIAGSAQVNSKDSDGWTPLHFAAFGGHFKCIEELIAKGGEVDSKNLLGWTPLHFAAYLGHLRCVQELIANSSQVNSKDLKDSTPLHLAAKNDHLECLQELIANGANVYCLDSNGASPLDVTEDFLCKLALIDFEFL